MYFGPKRVRNRGKSADKAVLKLPVFKPRDNEAAYVALLGEDYLTHAKLFPSGANPLSDGLHHVLAPFLLLSYVPIINDVNAFVNTY